MTAPPVDHNALVEQWRAKLERIRRELVHGFLHQHVWTHVRDEIQSRHPEADATFLVSYSAGYVATQMLLVRRLADDDPESASLASLIGRIEANPNVLTRTRFARGWGERTGEPGVGEAVWDRHFADRRNREHLNLALLAGDLDTLSKELEVVTTWATKTLAHLDPVRPQRVPKYHGGAGGAGHPGRPR